MKNLICYHRDQIVDTSILGTNVFCINPDDSTIFLVNGSGELIKLYPKEITSQTTDSTSKSHVIEKCCWLFPQQANETTSNVVVDMEYLLEENKVCLVIDDGNISTVGPFFRDQQQENNSLEPFLEVPLGISIQSASWSPDQELLVLVCKDNTFLVLDRFWNEVVSMKDVNPTEFGACSHVDVGWGSKSTQFHGSEGKGAREVNKVTTQSIFEWDDQVAKISWRRDGQMFSISSVDGDRRIIRIWNREAELQYTSKLSDGIENMLCWRPSGEIIATSQQHFNRHEICFLEPNGQPLGSFTLPDPCRTFILRQVVWSSDSSLLCVWGNFQEKENSGQKLMLWTRNNYHWYLKQELVFDGVKENLSKVMFDPVSGKALHLVFSSGMYVSLNFEWKICCSKNENIAVVDGSRLLVTCMSERIIPPPSYFYHVQFPECINHVSFDSVGNLQVVTSSRFRSVYTLSTKARHVNDEVEVLVSEKSSSNEITFKLSDVCSNSNNVINESIHRFHTKISLVNSCCEAEEPITLVQAIQSGCFLTVQKKSTNSGPSRVCFYKADGSIVTCLLIPHSILSLCEVTCSGSSDFVALQMTDGRIYSLNVHQVFDSKEEKNKMLWNQEEVEKKLKFMTKFNEACLDFCIIESSSCIEKKWIAIGLSLTSLSLFLDDRTILKNYITSFIVYDSSHLIVTCSDATLQIWPLNQVARAADKTGCKVMDHTKVIQLGLPVEKRTIERGSKIITGITSKGSLVLQAVRGNLEIIHPRCLLWITISKLINSEPPNYVPAFELMRKNRMNLSLIHDQNAEFFDLNIDGFVDQISAKNIDYLVLFLTELSEQVESIPGIQDFGPQITFETSEFTNVNKAKESKVRKICQRMRKIMIDKGAENVTFFVHPILVTYFKCNQVAEALILIKSLPDASIRTSAIDFLKYMVEVNALFNEALATYDMDIVLMVAQQSNKDPKEYLKLVNDFNQINPFHYRAFKIDMYLKRYEKAIENISKCSQEEKFFEEALQVIDCHRLYKTAIKLYAFEESKVSRIWYTFGEYLFSKKYYTESGQAFSRCKNYLKSVKSYQMSGDWNAAIRECIKLNDPIQSKLLYISLIDQLKSSGKIIEAASIAEKYQQNVESSFRILCDGNEWDHVSRMISSISSSNESNKNLGDIFKKEFWNKLKIHGNSLIERIEENSRKLNQYYLRLVEVREERMKQVNENGDDDHFFEDTMSEIGSEFSSSIKNGSVSASRNSGSLRTRMTGSGKGAKKVKTKTLKIKEGSSYEDIALMNGYKEIVVTLDSLQYEVGTVIKHLTNEYDPKERKTKDFEEIAIRLTSSFDHALNQLIREQLDLIWTYEVIENIIKRLPSLSLSPETESFLLTKPVMKNVTWKSILVSSSSTSR